MTGKTFLKLMVVTAIILGIGAIPVAGAAVPPMPDWSVVFVAHRGLAPGYPENTLAAYRQAIKLGAEVLEIDQIGRASCRERV